MFPQTRPAEQSDHRTSKTRKVVENFWAKERRNNLRKEREKVDRLDTHFDSLLVALFVYNLVHNLTNGDPLLVRNYRSLNGLGTSLG